MVFHVLNRAAGKRTLFPQPDDYDAFEEVLEETGGLCPMRVCAYCLMPNHWHLLLWPARDGELAAFMQRLTNTHVKRWKARRREFGWGPLYQGRYKSFPVQDDHHFYTVARYVERNALRANLVERAGDWRWCSFHRRRGTAAVLLSGWPVPFPKRWGSHVNRPLTEAELASLRRSGRRGSPYGDWVWIGETASALGLESTLRPRGRPRSSRMELENHETGDANTA